MKLPKKNYEIVRFKLGAIIYYDDEKEEWEAFNIGSKKYWGSSQTKYGALQELMMAIEIDMKNPNIPFFDMGIGGDVSENVDDLNKISEFEKTTLTFECIQVKGLIPDD